MRIHRLGHIEAKTLELVITDESLMRRAKQTYNYLSLGFTAEIEKEYGLTVEGIESVREVKSFDTSSTRLIIK